MRLAITAAVIGFLLLQIDGAVRAQETSIPRGYFQNTSVQANVAIYRNKVLLASLTFPKDTMVSVYPTDTMVSRYTDAQRTVSRYEFHGDIELRALPLAEAHPGPWHEIMAGAPVVLSGKGIGVILENVIPAGK